MNDTFDEILASAELANNEELEFSNDNFGSRKVRSDDMIIDDIESISNNIELSGDLDNFLDKQGELDRGRDSYDNDLGDGQSIHQEQTKDDGFDRG